MEEDNYQRKYGNVGGRKREGQMAGWERGDGGAAGLTFTERVFMDPR